MMNRRRFIAAGSAGIAGFLTACIDAAGPIEIEDASHLTSRPRTPTLTPAVGMSPLGIGIDRDGFIYVPPAYSPSTPAALIVLLHGAGRSSADWASAPMDSLFGARNIVVVAPDSRGASWDLRLGGFGADVQFMNLALDYAFSRCAVNPSKIALGGFSDGASYALSLGASNGDLFSSVLGFSPGFYQPGPIRGKPRIFVSHGTSDSILPFSWTSEQLTPSLKSSGYDVTFVQFEGGHFVPLSVANQAMDWFIA